MNFIPKSKCTVILKLQERLQKHVFLILCGLFSFFSNGQTYPKTININIENGLLQSTVWAIEEDSDHRIWIGTPGGIQIYDGFKLTTLPEIEGTILRLERRGDFMYCITISALYKFNTKNYSYKKAAFPESYFYLNDFLEEGIVLLDDKDSLFYFYDYDLQKKKEIPKRRETSADKLFSFSLRDKGFVGGVNGMFTMDSIIVTNSYCKQHIVYDAQTAFIASHKGLIKISVEGDKWQSEWFFKDLRITHLLVDRNKNLWVATGDNGIFMIHRNSLKSEFFPKTEQDGNSISCWSMKRIGKDLYTNSAFGLIPVEEMDWRSNEIFQNTKRLSAISSMEGNGFFLVGTRSDGIYRLKSGQAEQIHFNDQELVDNIIIDIQKTATGYLATSKYSFIQMNEKGDVVSKLITDFDEVFGYSMDFHQFGGDIINSRTTGVAVLDSTLKLKQNYYGDSIQVISMMRPFKNGLWGVSMDAGLLKLQNKRLVKKPFPDKHLFTLSNWKDEELWISGIGSIYQYSEAFTRPFKSENGFSIKEYNQGGVYRDTQGFLYYSGVGGVQKFHPDSLSYFPHGPTVMIEKDGSRLNSETTNQLNFDQSQIILDVQPVSISDQNYFQIEIEMNGQIVVVNEPKQLGFSLPYGLSILNLRIKDLVHNTETHVEYSFFRTLPFWKKGWFILGFIGMVILLIIGLFSSIGFLKSKRQNKLDQIRIEEQQKGLAAIIQAQEDERKRIAKDLHDGIVQQLGGLKLGLQKIFANKEDEETNKIVEILDDSANELRALSHKMMPRSLGELGLIPALTDMLENSLGHTKIHYQFEHYGIKGRMKEAVEIAIYRIAQELVNNVIKHSQGDKVNIQLLKNPNNIIFIVEDNGRGMAGENRKEGIGLMNIASRLNTIQGKVNYEPSPESGTLATIVIPVDQG